MHPAALATLSLSAILSAGIVVDQEPTSLPVSSTAELPSMEPTPGDVMPFGDAGLAWIPEPSSETVPPDAGRAPAPAVDAGAPTPLPAACVPIQQRIDHRRVYLKNVGDTVVLVGYEKATETWCQHHPEEGECRRPPAVSERDISEVTVTSTEEGASPEADAWIVKWLQELEECRVHAAAKTPAAPRKH
jgi:hypothetical protein